MTLMKSKIGLFLAAMILATGLLAKTIVYIPLGSANKVIAVNGVKNKVIATYSGIVNPHGLVATPDGEYLIAGSLSETPLKPGEPKTTPNSKLYLIHPGHGHVMSTIPVSGWTHHLAITPDGRYVLATHPMKGTVSVVDLVSNKVIKTIKTGRVPNYVVITKNGKSAFVSNRGGNDVVEISIPGWKVVRKLESGPSPDHLALSGDNSKLFVGNPRAGTVSIVSIASGKLLKTFQVGQGVHGVDVGDNGKTLFVSSKKEGLVTSFNTTTGTEKILHVSPAPYHIAAIHGTGKIYVSSRKKPLIWVINQKNLKVINTIKLPGGVGHQMAVVYQ